MTDTLATNRRLGWVVGLTSTAYFMVVLDDCTGCAPFAVGGGR